MRSRSIFLSLGLCAALAVPCLSPSAHAAGAAVGTATDAQKQVAQEHFIKGMEAFNAAQYDGALASFRSSFDAVASPNSHLMIVRCLAAMGRHLEGYDEASATVAEATAAAAQDPKYAPTVDAAREEQANLRAKLGFITVMGADSAPLGTQLYVGGRKIPRSRWVGPIAVEPGEITVMLGNDGQVQTTSVAAGGQATVTLKPNAAAPPPGDDDDDDDDDGAPYDGPDRLVLAGIAGGIGAVGLIGFGIFGAMAQSNYDELNDNCAPAGVVPPRDCAFTYASTQDDGRLFQGVANAGLVVGIIGAVAAGGFVIWEVADSPAGPEPVADAAIVRPKLLIGPGSVGLQGSF